jgi:dephospho-CoA kinase
MIIGLTGGIASGKSTVSCILRKQGAYIVDADKIAHKVLSRDNIGYDQVVEEFGEDILDENGHIDRKKLGNVVFPDTQKLERLEDITHPLIISIIRNKIKTYRDNYNHIVLDAPLLYETGLDQITDQDWVVYVDYQIQLNRLMQRDGISREETKRKIESQLSLEKKKVKADLVINNNTSIDQLRKTVIKNWKKLNPENV